MYSTLVNFSYFFVVGDVGEDEFCRNSRDKQMKLVFTPPDMIPYISFVHWTTTPTL